MVATRQVLRNGLALIGVSAPEKWNATGQPHLNQ
jgi:hypothetical protein